MKVLKQKKKMKLLSNFKPLHLLLFGVVAALILSGCFRPKGVLSRDKMTDVLVDMHKTDALLAEKNIAYGQYSKKAQYYNYIFKKHGITKAEFDSTLVWYTKNPIKFENMYEDVLKKLTVLQKDVDDNKFHPIDYANIGKIRSNIWLKPTHHKFTKDSVRTKLDFEIKQADFLYRDVYELKLMLKIPKEDSCKKQRIEMRINYYNGTSDHTYTLVKNDGLTRRFTLRMPAYRKLKVKSISGCLLGSSAYKGVFHSTLDSIKLIREFNSLQIDSLRRLVQEADTTHYVGAPSFDYLLAPQPAVHSFRKSRILKPL